MISYFLRAVELYKRKIVMYHTYQSCPKVEKRSDFIVTRDDPKKTMVTIDVIEKKGHERQ
jgi:hypothetical protein